MLTPRSADAPVQGQTSPEPPRRRILVVDDDEILSRFLHRLLTAEGFHVECVHDGALALTAVHERLDCVLLDLNMPKLDGLGVLEALRPRFPQLPILVLTARPRVESAAMTLGNGADDCLTKPFSCVELLARVRSLMRRSQAQVPSPNTQCGDLTIYRDELRVVRDGQRVDLTPREYELLEFLMRTPRTPVPRAVLLKELWGEDCETTSNVVDVYMKYVRDKIDRPGLPKLIRTVRGLGYAISEL